MAYSRLVVRVGIVGMGLILAAACSSTDSPMDGGTAGQGGVSGGHGGNSTGGSSNKAGNGGTTAGQGGKGGGTAGSEGGGKGGMAPGGSGGESLGGGGAAAGGDAGGAGGEAGAGGAAEPTVTQCIYTCQIDDDCQGGPVAICIQETHQCAAPAPQCVVDKDCMPFLSQWSQPCANTGECDDGFACVAWQDGGFCAAIPAVGQTPCDTGVPTTLPVFGGQGNIEVCASEDPRCFSGSCTPGCGDTSFGGCIPGYGDTCNKDTGMCECQQGSECMSGVCGKNSQCVQCVTDDDCAPLAAYGTDKCIAGSCGCSAADVCPDQGFANAVAVCK